MHKDELPKTVPDPLALARELFFLLKDSEYEMDCRNLIDPVYSYVIIGLKKRGGEITASFSVHITLEKSEYPIHIWGDHPVLEPVPSSILERRIPEIIKKHGFYCIRKSLCGANGTLFYASRKKPSLLARLLR